MKKLRNNQSEDKRQAHLLLDKVRQGIPVPIEQINAALYVLGDLI